MAHPPYRGVLSSKEIHPVLDALFVLIIIALFALVALAARGAQKL